VRAATATLLLPKLQNKAIKQKPAKRFLFYC
jgi:hypothetical protein